MTNEKLKSENNWLKSGLVFAVIIILLFKNKITEYLCELNEPDDLGCNCPKDSGFFNLEKNTNDRTEEAAINVELFERSEDSNVLNFSDKKLSSVYNYGTDELELTKILRNG